MTAVLALDLATNAGYAVIEDGEILTSGSWPLAMGIPTGVRDRPSPEARHAQIVRSLRRQVRGVLAHQHVDVVAIERDFGRGAGGRLLACLQNAAQEAALEAGVAALSIPLSTWRALRPREAGEGSEANVRMVQVRGPSSLPPRGPRSARW